MSRSRRVAGQMKEQLKEQKKMNDLLCGSVQDIKGADTLDPVSRRARLGPGTRRA